MIIRLLEKNTKIDDFYLKAKMEKKQGKTVVCV